MGYVMKFQQYEVIWRYGDMEQSEVRVIVESKRETRQASNIFLPFVWQEMEYFYNVLK